MKARVVIALVKLIKFKSFYNTNMQHIAHFINNQYAVLTIIDLNLILPQIR